MKKKVAPQENSLEPPPPEHYQLLVGEAWAEHDEIEEEEAGEAADWIVPPLRHPYPLFWEEEENEI